MKRKPRYAKEESVLKMHKSEFVLALIVIVVLVIVFGVVIYLSGDNIPESLPLQSEPESSSVSISEKPESASKPVISEPESSETEEAVFVPYEELTALYNVNKDVFAWMKIEGTKIDYPVMYTPYDPEKYLRLDIGGNYSVAGNLFIDANCSIDPESDNLIIYGHNMQDGSMFRDLMNYADEEYFKEHPIVEVYTIGENRQYEVLAAFYDRVYYKYEDCFKFYKFINAEDEDMFREAITYYKENSEYETGVDAEYGDRLITLVTCSYHHQYGRFVVIGREVNNNSELID